EADELDDLDGVIEVDDGADGGERVDDAGAGQRLRVGGGDEPVTLADLPGVRHGAVDHGQLPGGPDVVAVARRGLVGARRGRDGRELEAELAEAVGDASHQAPLGRLRYATRPDPSGPVTTWTSSQP